MTVPRITAHGKDESDRLLRPPHVSLLFFYCYWRPDYRFNRLNFFDMCLTDIGLDDRVKHMTKNRKRIEAQSVAISEANYSSSCNRYPLDLLLIALLLVAVQWITDQQQDDGRFARYRFYTWKRNTRCSRSLTSKQEVRKTDLVHLFLFNQLVNVFFILCGLWIRKQEVEMMTTENGRDVQLTVTPLSFSISFPMLCRVTKK